VSTGQNVTVWEEGRHETGRKNVTEWMTFHNPGKKSGRFVTDTLHPPTGLGERKIPGHFFWIRSVTVDVVNPRTLHWEAL
jgi:hypothetical protein